MDLSAASALSGLSCVDLDTRFKSERGAWFDWLMNETESEDGGFEPRTVKTEDFQMNWGTPYAWQDARDGPHREEEQSKACSSLHDHASATSDLQMTMEGKKTGCEQDPMAKCVVWCHEHCHKSHNDARKKALADLCFEHEASLVCHKKAAKFGVWLSCTVQPDYILITDWREAKPCIDIISTGLRFTQMIVYCDTDSTLRKASEWVNRLPAEAGRVHAVKGMDGVQAHLLKTFSEEAEAESEICATASTPSEIGSESPEHEVDADTASQSEDEFKQPGMFVFTPEQARLPFVSMTLEGQTEQAPLPFVPVMTAPVFQAVSPAASPVLEVANRITAPVFQAVSPAASPVLEVLGPVLFSHTLQGLKQALDDAMPAYYTD